MHPFSPEIHQPIWVDVAKEIYSRLERMSVGDRMPTERELCKELGVSRVTLRRAMEPLHREGYLQTRRGGGTRLVKPIPPTAGAQTNSPKILGLVVPTPEISLISRIVCGVEKFAVNAGYHTALAHDYGDMDYQLRQLERMMDGNISGIAVFPDSGNLMRAEFHNLIKRIMALSIPVVMIDRYIPEIGTQIVMSDNFAGMYASTEHMILSGYRKLALFSFGEEGDIADHERRKGFTSALKDYGLPSEPVFEESLGTRNHEKLARQAITRHLPPKGQPLSFDGVVCMQDNMAYGAFLALRDAGWRVPEDVGLVGYDNLDRELYLADGLKLTSIDQSAEEIGMETARRLISQIEGKGKASETRAQCTLIKPHLVVRGSCGMGAKPKVSR